jgi:hypothetical protein
MGRLRLLNFVTQLSNRGDAINLSAIAFILTEKKFRGPFFRACEIIYALWLIYALRREPKLTLGKCQVSFRYWRKRFGTNNLVLFRAVLDDFSNYQICCDYLDLNQRRTLRETIISYNGRPSVLYLTLFSKHLEFVTSTVRFGRLRRV